jgi:glycosyltransferase involved in cell wall biosynthesis
VAEPLVSILIPCHNAAPWLAATLASARAQTWPRREIILVDDGSTDGSLALAHSLAGPDLRIFTQKNAGQCAALNQGLREARGDYFQYLDADDLLAPEKISHQLALLRPHASDTLATCSWARFTHEPSEARFAPEPIWRDHRPVDWLISSWSGGGMMHGAAWLIPRNVAERAGAWDERLSLINDLDYFTRLVLASRRVVFCPAARTYYRAHQGTSLSGSKSRSAWDSAFLATATAASALLARENSPRTRRAAADNLQRLLFGAYPYAPDLVKKAERRVRELGGSSIKPGGGRMFQGLRRIIGWKLARRLQVAARKSRAAQSRSPHDHATP